MQTLLGNWLLLPLNVLVEVTKTRLFQMAGVHFGVQATIKFIANWAAVNPNGAVTQTLEP